MQPWTSRSLDVHDVAYRCSCVTRHRRVRRCRTCVVNAGLALLMTRSRQRRRPLERASLDETTTAQHVCRDWKTSVRVYCELKLTVPSQTACRRDTRICVCCVCRLLTPAPARQRRNDWWTVCTVPVASGYVSTVLYRHLCVFV